MASDAEAIRALVAMRAEMLSAGVNGWPNTLQDVIAALSQEPSRWQPTDADLHIIHRCVADYAHEVHGIIYPVWVSEAHELLKRMPLPASPVQEQEH